MNNVAETSNVVEMHSFRASMSDLDDPLEALLREANIPDFEMESEATEILESNKGLEALALLSMSEEELSSHLEKSIAGLREGISRLKFYLTDVHEAINGL